MTIITLKPDDLLGAKPPIEPKAPCFIAGGAVRRWFSGREDLADVDVFGPDRAALEKFCDRFTKIDETKQAITYQHNGTRIQAILIPFPTVNAAFDAFDYNVCQFAWEESGVSATPEAVLGVLRGRLAVHTLKKEFVLDSMRRAFKYQRKGFTPCIGTMQTLSSMIRSLTEDELKKQVVMSPRGGVRLGIRFD